MNYGSLGSLSRSPVSGDLEFFFRKEVFSAFALSDKSKLHGFYYPCPSTEEYKEVTIKHDFLITPIPPELWRASARIRVYLKNSPRTLNALCNFLEKEKISIVHSESTRSAYRYATWTLHIVFEKLLTQGDLGYLEGESCYAKTKEAVGNFIIDFKKEMAVHLFTAHSRELVIGHPNYTLAFFDNYRKSPGKHKDPFTLKVHDPDGSHRKQKLIGDHILKDILNDLCIVQDKFLPATTFSEIDTTELNLRTVLIPEEDAKRFCKVSLKYKCKPDAKKDTYPGIMHAITRGIPPHYNIWMSYDRTIDNEPVENGEIFLIVENTTYPLTQKTPRLKETGNANEDKGAYDEDTGTVASYQEAATILFDRIVANHKKTDKPEFIVTKYRVLPLPTAGVVEEILLEEGKIGPFLYDVFISYSRKNEDYVNETLLEIFDKHGIVYFIDVKDIETGGYLDETILKGIEQSREMCVVVSKESAKSKWMVLERGAAWGLGKRMTGILIADRLKTPDILEDKLYVKGYEVKDKLGLPDLKKYVEDIIKRRNKNGAKVYSSIFLK